MELSIVSTLYNSEKFIPELLAQLIKIVKEIGIDETNYEIILVDDGSPDNSLEVAINEKKKYPNVNITIIELSRNFGHHNAFFAGFEIAKGYYTFLIDSDMDVDVSVLKIFFRKIKEEPSLDVVYGVITKRDNTISDKISKLFWKLFNKFSNINLPANITTERIFNQKYRESLCRLGDYNLFLGGLYHWVGFNMHSVQVIRKSNRIRSNYNLKKKVNLFINAITSFSSYPLILMFNFSLIFILISGIYLSILFVRKIIYPETIIMGFTSIVSLISFFGSIIVFCLSIIGLYIEKIYNQVKNRPRYIVRNIF
ncbi:MAG: glycosyltransferase family 2 protein [Thermoplasmata archaeon]